MDRERLDSRAGELRRRPASKAPIRLGVRENVAQLALLVFAFVSARAGLERTVSLPIAEREFDLISSL